MNKEELREKLCDYFDIDRDCYYYILTRDKSAFGYGTIHLDDFREFDNDLIDDIVNYVFKNKGVDE